MTEREVVEQNRKNSQGWVDFLTKELEENPTDELAAAVIKEHKKYVRSCDRFLKTLK